jgi:polysaccharide chain length determinant protein (PEP-CTERM system associated)
MQQYLNQLWKRRWTIIAVSWFLCLAGWGYVALLPDIYRSSARIYVDTSNLLRPLLKNIAVERYIGDEVLLMRQTLLSKPNIQRVLRITDLDLTIKTPEGMEDLVRQVTLDTRLTSTKTNLFSISFDHRDPKRARDVVQAFITVFIETNLGESRTDMETAQKFLKEEKNAYREKLEAAEKRLAEFKREYGNLLPQASGRVYSNYYNGKEALRDAEAQRDVLKEQLSEINPFIEFSDGFAQSGAGPPAGTDFQIVELEDLIEKLLARYTEKHPDVLAARRRLVGMKEKQNTERASLANSGTDEGGGSAVNYRESNPVYEAVKVKLVQVEANIGMQKERVERWHNEWQQIEGQAKLSPFLAAELTKLNRDYEMIKGKYAQLSSRLESAKITKKRNIRAEKVQFRLIDLPDIPVKPNGPPRLLYLIVVLIFGLAGGIGVSVLLILGDDTIPDVRTLRSSFAIPVVGFVRDLRMGSATRLRFMDNLGVVLAGGCLLAASGALMAIEYQFGLGNVVSGDAVLESAWVIKDMLMDGIAKLTSQIL